MLPAKLFLKGILPFVLLGSVVPQELPFEIPVQLVGFPIIIMAVRLSNFLKKLSYAVNPGTYRSRTRRGSDHLPMDITEIEKKLIHEMGDKVCVYEDICQEYADKVNHEQNFVLDWQDIFRHYEKFPRGKKEFYLLSVFMGDIVKSKELCSQLAKRGRSCNGVSRRNQTSNEEINSLQGHYQAPQKYHHIPSERHGVPQVQHHSSQRVQLSHGHQSQDQPQEHPAKEHSTSHPSPHLEMNRQVSSNHHVHQQVHRHHVEIHYDNSQDGLVFGQNPPHHIHFTTRRVIGSQN